VTGRAARWDLEHFRQAVIVGLSQIGCQPGVTSSRAHVPTTAADRDSRPLWHLGSRDAQKHGDCVSLLVPGGVVRAGLRARYEMPSRMPT
jgi:hypothetical protein